MKKLAVVIVAALFVLSGCGQPAPDSGYVRDKKFTAAHDTSYTTYDCVYRNKNGVCQVTIPHEHVTHHPDKWEIKLEDCTKDDDGKTKCRKGWKTVDQQTYESYKVGSHYPDAT